MAGTSRPRAARHDEPVVKVSSEWVNIRSVLCGEVPWDDGFPAGSPASWTLVSHRAMVFVGAAPLERSPELGHAKQWHPPADPTDHGRRYGAADPEAAARVVHGYCGEAYS